MPAVNYSKLYKNSRTAAFQFMHYKLPYKNTYKTQIAMRFNGLADKECDVLDIRLLLIQSVQIQRDMVNITIRSSLFVNSFIRSYLFINITIRWFFYFSSLGLTLFMIGWGSMGGAKKASPTRFSAVTSTNVGISSPKLCDFQF